MRRCFSAFVGGEGSITSQVSGARFAGSAESKVCKNVVPVRGNPTTKRGARIWCCAISGCRLRSRCSKSRLRKMRRISERSAMFPTTFRRASPQHDSSSRPSGSRKSPSPKSFRLVRRFAVSINSSGGMRRLTLPLSIAPNRLRARMAIGERKRSMVAADCIGQDVPVARSMMKAQASPLVILSDNLRREEEKATFGAGCFWGVEETFRKLKGVTDTAVGYAGGNKDNPTYEDVCTDETGHAEVVQVKFDPAQISYRELLDVFWANHNPTTLNR